MADYPGLARMISSHREAAIFRRFDALNLKSLLYMQAEILHLEAELEGFEIDDKSATDSNRARLVKSVHDLRKSAGKGIGSQGSVIQEIRTKLQEYSMSSRTQICVADQVPIRQMGRCFNTSCCVRLPSRHQTMSNACANGFSEVTAVNPS